MPLPNLSPQDTAKWVVLLVVALLQYIVLGVGLYVYPQYCKEDMHTSALSGRAWLNELLVGHPKRIYIALGMRRHVFLALVLQIRALGYMESQQSRLYLDESLAIFLYTCVTGLAIDHVAERFQHSHTTISEHFRKILDILSGPQFYSKYVQLPDANAPPPPAIRNNPKWWPYFQNVLGAMDEDLHSARNRKGGVTQNCLAVVSFNMRFLFFTSGWDGCAADASMYSAARLRDLPIPEGKSYLADAGFGICEALLVPYRQTRYHLAEWARAQLRPANYKELYNLRHASARNVVERIFGVIKHRWTILTRPPHYDMKVQAKIPSALVALHNFILEHDEEDIDRWILDEGAEDNLRGTRREQEIDFGRLSTTGRVSAAEKERAEKTRDEIAKAMWDDYQEYLDTRMDVDNNYYGDIQPEALD
ncbi:putative transposase [Mycena sanguinolenta]|uniref:Putative transposase n=1 Tax=Mycena sanguinolenta TaxID=230812 RepID=A0A8H7CVM3_9AGAR|nr:putative transposase [Mycena sanguinolenta]